MGVMKDLSINLREYIWYWPIEAEDREQFCKKMTVEQFVNITDINAWKMVHGFFVGTELDWTCSNI